MLGFILSKMQMLLFAVGIAVVALLFYDFVSRIGLNESASTLLLSESKIISDQLNNDLLCSDKFTTLPSALNYGYQQEKFFYDLEFSTKQLQSGEITENLLIMRIVEHRRSSTSAKNIIAAKSISSDAEFVLVSPAFLLETTSLDLAYNNGTNLDINLYPRASSKTAVLAASPNAFVALKEVVGGKKKIYIIPCSTEKEPNNCVRNVLRLGCHLLKLAGKTSPTDLIPSCFNKSSEVADSYSKSSNYNWDDCTKLFPEVTKGAGSVS